MSKNSKRVDTRTDEIPDAHHEDLRVIDKQVTTFYDDGEERFLARELLRAKLRERAETAKDENVVIPQLSELEKATRRQYNKLQALSVGMNEQQLELKLLMRRFPDAHSLFNVATKLAEYELKDRERVELKQYWSEGASAKEVKRKTLLPKNAAEAEAAAKKAAGLT